MTDETLAAIVRGAHADSNVIAAFLHGSRAVGHERPDSDYDADWWTDGLVQGRVLFDRSDGAVESILARLGAANDVERPYDAYLNAFVRGKAAARRGDELGTRLHAADSVRYLVAALSALKGVRPRFHDRLTGTLDEWEPRLVELLRDPTVEHQLALFDSVRTLMESRGVKAHTLWKDEQLT